MSTPGLRRPLETWAFVVGLVRAVTQPAADVAGCDARVESLADDSLIVRALMTAADAFARAASDSAAVAVWHRILSMLVPGPLDERIRAVGCIAAAAAITALILRLAASGSEPLTWTVPAAVGVIALAGIVGARPIARAIVSHHS